MVALRDGSQVQDSRLARLTHFDERSRSYPVGAAVEGKEPRSYTWSCGKYLDQGSEGACVGFAMTHELVARPAVVTRGMTQRFAREDVYWEAQKIDPWQGGSYPGASPIYEGTAVLAGAQVLRSKGYIDEYRWAFGLSDLVLAVGYCGPAILGIPWYEGMFNVAPCGYLHVTGQVAGGHAILCNGVSVKKRTFNLHNSWGAGWGNGGDATITWDEMERLLHENGEAVIPMKRHVL